jgi:cation:H+ antiporter
MVILNLVLFLVFLFIVSKSADYATRYSSRLARAFHFSEFIVSFFIVAVISTFPEATISILSAVKGMPEFGLGTLLGSNVADLALVFGIVALISAKGVSVKSEILREDFFYLALLVFPLLLGADGYLSRIDGILLVVAGALFFFTLSIESKMFQKKFDGLKGHRFLESLVLLVLSLIVLLVSANYAIKFGVDFANDIGIPSLLVSLTVVSIGTCLPELMFSIRAVRKNHDELALGDVLGTVITDATIILGAVAIISPFHFNPAIIFVTGGAMVIAGLLTIHFISTGKVLTKKEGLFLLLFYGVYLITEILVSGLI